MKNIFDAIKDILNAIAAILVLGPIFLVAFIYVLLVQNWASLIVGLAIYLALKGKK